MSTINAISGQTYGPLTQIINNATSTEAQLNNLTEQSSTGLISQTYGGLGGGAAKIVLSVSPQISSANAQAAAINSTTGAITVQQNALTEISALTTSVVSSLSSLNTLDTNGASAAAVVTAAAKSALVQIATLLDTKDGEVYVFGGQNSSQPPIPDPDDITSSNFFTQIQSAIANLGTNGAAATTASVLGIASSNTAGTTPFTAGLTATNLPSVTLANGQQITTGIAANGNGFVTSAGAGTTSTGSYIRDILSGLASVASLTPSQIGGTNFQAFLTSTQASLTNANDTLNDDAGVLGNIQAQLTTQATNLGTTVTALTNQVSNADSVDAAATITQISAVQTALESSYQLIATLKSLNLASYL